MNDEQDITEMKSLLPEPPLLLLDDLRRMIEDTRQGVATAVNTALCLLYWRVGKRISNAILQGTRAGYGKEIIGRLILVLTLDSCSCSYS